MGRVRIAEAIAGLQMVAGGVSTPPALFRLGSGREQPRTGLRVTGDA
jgi:hypothetical protein